MRIMAPRFVIVMFAFLVMTACGDPYVTVVRFEATPPELPPGGGEVELSWETRNAEDVILQPGGHHSLPESGTLKTVITESTDFRLILSGRVRDASRRDSLKTLRVEVQTLEVSGTVVDGEGAPAPNLEVSINGGDPTVTDAAGRFTIGGVTPPYALRVHDRAQAPSAPDQLWLDLTDLHPTVFSEATSTSQPRELFDVEVAWSGGGVSDVPPGATPFTLLTAFSRHDSEHSYFSDANASGAGALRLWHPDDLSGPIKVFVLQGFTEDVVEGPVVRSIFYYQRLGRAELAASNTESPADAGTVEMMPMTTTTVDVEVIAGPWLERSLGALSIVLPGFAPLRLFGDGSHARSYQLTAPAIPGAMLSFNGWAIGTAPAGEADPQIHLGDVAWTGTGPLRLEVDSPPVAVTPTRAAPFGGRFVFTRELPGPCRVTLGTLVGQVEIHSDRREFTAAFLESIGVEVEERGYWDAECPSGFASLDEARKDLARYRSALRVEPGQMLGQFGIISY